MSVTKEHAINLFQPYYHLINPENSYPIDYNVQLQDSLSPRGKPMIQATLRLGYLELKRVVINYHLKDCTKQYIKELQEAMMIFFVLHNFQAIQEFIDIHQKKE